MQAQGILLTMLGTGTSKPGQDIQANDHAFGDIMTNLSGKNESISNFKRGLKVDNQRGFTEGQKLSFRESVKQPAAEKPAVNAETTDLMTDDSNAEIAAGLAEDLIGDVLKDMFGLSEEDLKDIMEQIGIQMNDLMLPFNQDTLSFEGIDMEQIKNLVLVFHGIEDAAAILTNPQLEQELEALTGEMESVLERMKELTLASENHITLLQGNGIKEKNIPETVSDQSMADAQTDSTVIISAETSDTSEDNLQQDNGTNAEDGLSQKTDSRISSAAPKTDTPERQTPVDTFAVKLNDAVSHAMEESGQISGPKTNIVDQVVHHIRARVLPETTSMELALNPESLGRVNITVSITNGVTKASMTVTNETAKEALESQLITLKETFSEKGIKVDSVEVTVSDFGFKKESDSREERNRAKQNTNKKIRSGSLHSVDEDDGIENNTGEELMDTERTGTEDNVIDYIA